MKVYVTNYKLDHSYALLLLVDFLDIESMAVYYIVSTIMFIIFSKRYRSQRTRSESLYTQFSEHIPHFS
jgi:hypothetical protein